MWGGRRIDKLHMRRFILLGRGHTEADLSGPEQSNGSELLLTDSNARAPMANFTARRDKCYTIISDV
jgi:hypothetical protein